MAQAGDPGSDLGCSPRVDGPEMNPAALAGHSLDLPPRAQWGRNETPESKKATRLGGLSA